MKKLLTSFLLLLGFVQAFAATYRTYVGHYLSGDTYTILIDSDTAFGETAIAQLCYTPSGGGMAFTGFVNGAFDLGDIYPTANWSVVISVPPGATNIRLELATLNQSSMGYGYTGCNIVLSLPLAVEMVDFSAKKTAQTINLTWETASERDNSHFEIEKSTNGTSFKSIGRKEGAGDSAAPTRYEFTDKEPAQGANYYRLKSVETTGSAEYSAITVVLFGSTKQQIFAYPNPTTTELNATIDLEEDGDLSVQVTDLLGKVFMVQQSEGIKGSNAVLVNTESLPNGTYCLHINGWITKFVKK